MVYIFKTLVSIHMNLYVFLQGEVLGFTSEIILRKRLNAVVRLFRGYCLPS